MSVCEVAAVVPVTEVTAEQNAPSPCWRRWRMLVPATKLLLADFATVATVAGNSSWRLMNSNADRIAVADRRCCCVIRLARTPAPRKLIGCESARTPKQECLPAMRK
jgi:hypothetical protein